MKRLIFLITMLAACQEPVADPGTDGGIRVEVLALPGPDTPAARPIQPVVIQVTTANGEAVPGVDVRFEAVAPGLGFDDGAGAFRVAARRTTDADGRAQAHVLYSTRAGESVVAISVPAYQVTHSAVLTVLPGAAVGLRLSPRDTSVSASGGFVYRGALIDRWNNEFAAPLTYSTSNGAVSVDSNGRVTAQHLGISTVRVSGTVNGVTSTDSGFVGVVPDAQVAWTGSDGQLRVSNLDGTGSLQLGLRGSGAWWEPNGQRLVFSDFEQLYVRDANGDVDALELPRLYGLRASEWSRDGWIYLHAAPTEGESARIYRVRPNGLGLEKLLDIPAASPAPSPDGTRVAFSTLSGIGVLNLADGDYQIFKTTAGGGAPRWSPDGQWIAFTSPGFGEVKIMRPDASQIRSLGRHALAPGLTWSLDSRWIIGSRPENAIVIDVATGKMANLPWRGSAPTWRN